MSNSVIRLVEQWQDGVNREGNFRCLFDLFYRPVFGFFQKRGFPTEQCRDLTQEMFVRVYKGIGEFRRESSFETWLFLIAANVYRNALRHEAVGKRAGRHVSLGETHEEAAAADSSPDGKGGLQLADDMRPDPLARIIDGERRLVLRQAVESLPEQMRRCLALRVYQELSYQEIAVVMRLSVETVKAHLYQAHRQLKDKLAGYFDEANLEISGG